MIFRPIEQRDLTIYIEMATDFYASPAVLHSIPTDHIENTAKAVLEGSPFANIYIFEQDGTVVGYGLLAHTHSQEAGGMVCWLEEIYVRPTCAAPGSAALFLNLSKTPSLPHGIAWRSSPITCVSRTFITATGLRRWGTRATCSKTGSNRALALGVFSKNGEKSRGGCCFFIGFMIQ